MSDLGEANPKPEPSRAAGLTGRRKSNGGELDYDASSIKVLEGLEAVRKRPAMYIGSTREEGLHHLAYEVVDNSIDEVLAGFCDQVDVTIHVDNSVTVVDNGRGIPVDYHEGEKKSAAEVVMTTLHSGGKFDDNSYKVSGGLHGVGVSCVNALAEELELEIWRDSRVYQQSYRRGRPLAPLQETGRTDRRGTKITFRPDSTIFDTLDFHFDTLSQRLRELSFLNKGVVITVTDERSDKTHQFKYAGGISEFVKHLNRNRTVLHRPPIHFEAERETTSGELIRLEVAIQYNDGYAENVFSFANNINTVDGGTHLSGGRSTSRPWRRHALVRPPARPESGPGARVPWIPRPCPASWPIARKRTRLTARFLWWRAIPPAVRPSRAGIGSSRRFSP